MNKFKTGLVTLAAAGMLAGCSHGTADTKPNAAVKTEGEAPVGEAPIPAKKVYNESDVLKHLGAKNYIVTLDDGTKCEIAVVMTDASMVSTYAGAGDVVATNADGSVGVKIVSPEAATCQTALTEKLSDFPKEEAQ